MRPVPKSDFLLIKLVESGCDQSVDIYGAKSDNNSESLVVRKHDLCPYSLYKHVAVFTFTHIWLLV